MSDIKTLTSGGVTRWIKDEAARNDIDLLKKQTNQAFGGRNLAELFQDEIAHYDSPWQWAKDRCDGKYLKDLMVRDYLPLTLTTGEQTEQQIAGINSYYDATDQPVPYHIDFISRDCLAATVQWNTTNDNNGNAASPYPYMVSNLKAWLNDTVYPTLPADLKAVIKNKRLLIEQRYSASGKLNDATSWGWQDLGPIWVPSEFEVIGATTWGTKAWSAGPSVQYTIFANSIIDRIKGAGKDGSRCWWWTLTPRGDSPTSVCGVNYNGDVNYYNASYAGRAPLCFRVSA